MSGQTALTVAIVAVVALLLGLRWIVRRVGCNCHLCGERMVFFRDLKEEEQGEILSYFQEYEHRLPKTNAILVCRGCRIVYDDFSGEARSMEGDDITYCKVCKSPWVSYLGGHIRSGDTRDITGFREKNSSLIDSIECLRCTREPIDALSCAACDTKVRVLGCRMCHTLHAWTSVRKNGLKFLVPLTDKAVASGPGEFLLRDM